MPRNKAHGGNGAASCRYSWRAVPHSHGPWQKLWNRKHELLTGWQVPVGMPVNVGVAWVAGTHSSPAGQLFESTLHPELGAGAAVVAYFSGRQTGMETVYPPTLVSTIWHVSPWMHAKLHTAGGLSVAEPVEPVEPAGRLR